MNSATIIDKIKEELEKISISWNDNMGRKIQMKLLEEISILENIDQLIKQFIENIQDCINLFPETEIESYYNKLLLFLNEEL